MCGLAWVCFLFCVSVFACFALVRVLCMCFFFLYFVVLLSTGGVFISVVDLLFLFSYVVF